MGRSGKATCSQCCLCCDIGVDFDNMIDIMKCNTGIACDIVANLTEESRISAIALSTLKERDREVAESPMIQSTSGGSCCELTRILHIARKFNQFSYQRHDMTSDSGLS